MTPVRPKTEVQEQNEKHIKFLCTGNASMVEKALYFFDTSFLPVYTEKDELMRMLRHEWMLALKTALTRTTPTEKQKFLILERFIQHADPHCVQPVLIAYVNVCSRDKRKPFETMLREVNPKLLEVEQIRELFPYAIG